MVLADLLSSRMHDVLRDEKKLVYGCEATLFDNGFEKSAVVNTSLEPEKLDAVLEEIFKTIAGFAQTINEKDLEPYLASGEENLADVYNDPKDNGIRLAGTLMRGDEYTPLNYDVEVARTLTTAQLQEGLRGLFQGRFFMVAAGPVSSAPAIEGYVNQLRRDLAIEAHDQTPYIKRDFNI